MSSSAELCGIFDRKSDVNVGPFFIRSPSNGVMTHERSDVLRSVNLFQKAVRATLTDIFLGNRMS